MVHINAAQHCTEGAVDPVNLLTCLWNMPPLTSTPQNQWFFICPVFSLECYPLSYHTISHLGHITASHTTFLPLTECSCSWYLLDGTKCSNVPCIFRKYWLDYSYRTSFPGSVYDTSSVFINKYECRCATPVAARLFCSPPFLNVRCYIYIFTVYAAADRVRLLAHPSNISKHTSTSVPDCWTTFQETCNSTRRW